MHSSIFSRQSVHPASSLEILGRGNCCRDAAASQPIRSDQRHTQRWKQSCGPTTAVCHRLRHARCQRAGNLHHRLMKFTSTLLADASGSLGGFYATRGQGALVLRTRTKRPRGVSLRGLKQQSKFRICAATWKNLSEIQRNAWRQTNFGSLSGFPLFMSCNLTLLASDIPLRRSPVFTDPLPIIRPVFTLTPNVGAQTLLIQFTAAPGPSARYFIFASAPRSSGSLTQKHRRWTLITWRDVATSFNIAPFWVARFGPLASGQRITILCQNTGVNSGFRGPKQSTEIVL